MARVGPRRVLEALRLHHEPAAAGALWSETALTAPLRSGGVPRLSELGGVALLMAWPDERALESFLTSSRLARLMAGGWRVRLEPVRSWGSWSPLPDLPRGQTRELDGEVAVLTLGRLRLRRAVPFLAASAPAERTAVRHPAMLAGTALARLPRFVATFSLWRSEAEMRDYAVGSDPDAHRRAIAAHRRRPFHDESVFVRFRPYAAEGSWNGRNPLA